MPTHPEQFRGTELDVDASRQKMEKLIAKWKASCPTRPRAEQSSSQRSPTCWPRRSPEHDRGRSDDTLARDGRRRSSGEASWSRLIPYQGRPAASSRNASTAPATASTTSIDAGSCRSSRPPGDGRNADAVRALPASSFQHPARLASLEAHSWNLRAIYYYR
jgi:hypothetical protein